MPSSILHIHEDLPLRTLAIEVEGAWRVLGDHHLDYCCGGTRTLREACQTAGVDVARVLGELERTRARGHGAEGETRWVDHAPWELVEHLLATHHELTWRELARLEPIFDTVVRTHGAKQPELAELRDVFAALRADLEVHLTKEERVLFPWVLSLRVHEAEGTSPPRPPFGDPRHPIRVMLAEHDAAGELLHRLREGTRGYAPPEGACAKQRALYEGLAALDRDLMRHVSLENDVLFPMLTPR